MQCAFSKYSGCGNDFLLIDNRSKFFPSDDRVLIAKLCKRRLGIGADGIILLENSHSADFRMHIYNADGSEAEMCGNGIRCLMKFIRQLGFTKPQYTIETLLEQVTASYRNDQVSVSMPPPKHVCWSIDLPIEPHQWNLHFLDTGVPHAVIFTEDIESIDLNTIAPKIRYHTHFGPRGTNVDFAAIKQNQLVQMRTYERGVEQETLACGTGAVAVALAAAKVYRLQSPIQIETRSQEILEIQFSGEIPTDLLMTGPAAFIFEGKIDLLDFQLNGSKHFM